MDECDKSTYQCITPYRKDPKTGQCTLEGCAKGSVQEKP